MSRRQELRESIERKAMETMSLLESWGSMLSNSGVIKLPILGGSNNTNVAGNFEGFPYNSA